MIEILYEDKDLVFCVKPVGVSAESELPEALSQQLGGTFYTLHRLDVPVGGVMVFARNKSAAAQISRKIAEHTDFKKVYLAVCEGVPEQTEGVMEDLLFKDSAKNKSFVVKRERKGVKKALLTYKVASVGEYNGKACSLVEVELKTGRSHQIRVQFASRKHPLLGDKKYGSSQNCAIALFSHRIETSGKSCCANPPEEGVWSVFK